MQRILSLYEIKTDQSSRRSLTFYRVFTAVGIVGVPVGSLLGLMSHSGLHFKLYLAAIAMITLPAYLGLAVEGLYFGAFGSRFRGRGLRSYPLIRVSFVPFVPPAFGVMFSYLVREFGGSPWVGAVVGTLAGLALVVWETSSLWRRGEEPG